MVGLKKLFLRFKGYTSCFLSCFLFSDARQPGSLIEQLNLINFSLFLLSISKQWFRESFVCISSIFLADWSDTFLKGFVVDVIDLTIKPTLVQKVRLFLCDAKFFLRTK